MPRSSKTKSSGPYAVGAVRALLGFLCMATSAPAAGPQDPAVTGAEGTCRLLAPATGGAESHYAIVKVGPLPEPGDVAFTAYVLPAGGRAADRFRVKGMFPCVVEDHGLLHLRGWPVDVTGRADILIKARAGSTTRVYRAADALTVRRQPVDVALLIDDSRSMRHTDPGKLRVTAAKLFADIAAARGDVNSLAVIAFTYKAEALLRPTPVKHREALASALEGLRASGRTDMDIAFSFALRLLDPSTKTRKIAIVLSDGRDEPGRYMDRHRAFVKRGWPVYTVGLSEHADVETLRRIASDTGGECFYAPTAEELADIFRTIALSIHHSVTVAEWDAAAGMTRAVPVDDSIRLLSFLVSGEQAKVSVRSPDGAVRVDLRPVSGDAFEEVTSPCAGAWIAEAAMAGRVSVSASSDLELVPYPLEGPFRCGTPLRLACLLVRGHRGIAGARVGAHVVGPGGVEAVRLFDDGAHGDGQAGDGVYAARYVPEAGAGGYACRLSALGKTGAGWEYERTAGLAFKAAPAEARVAAAEKEPVAVPDVPPEAPAEPPEEPVAEIDAAMSLVESAQEETVVDPMTSAPPAAVAADAAPGPSVASESVVSAAPRPLSVPGWLRLLVALILLALLLYLFLRWLLRTRLTLPRMLKYLLASMAAHAMLFLMTMNILLETGTVELKDLSPTLAVKVKAVEDVVGFELTPAGRAVAVTERESDATVRRKKAPDALQHERHAQAPEAMPRASVVAREPADRRPDMAGELPLPVKKAVRQQELRERAALKEKTEARVSSSVMERAMRAEKAPAPETSRTGPATHAPVSEIRPRERVTGQLPGATATPGQIKHKMSARKQDGPQAEDVGERPSVATHRVAKQALRDLPESGLRLHKASVASEPVRESVQSAAAARPVSAAPRPVIPVGRTTPVESATTAGKQPLAPAEGPEPERPEVAIKSGDRGGIAESTPLQMSVPAPAQAGADPARVEASHRVGASAPIQAALPVPDTRTAAETRPGAAEVTAGVGTKSTGAAPAPVTDEKTRLRVKAVRRKAGEPGARSVSEARMAIRGTDTDTRRSEPGAGSPVTARDAETGPAGMRVAGVLAGTAPGGVDKQGIAAAAEPTLQDGDRVAVKRVSGGESAGTPSRAAVPARRLLRNGEQTGVARRSPEGAGQDAAAPGADAPSLLPLETVSAATAQVGSGVTAHRKQGPGRAEVVKDDARVPTKAVKAEAAASGGVVARAELHVKAGGVPSSTPSRRVRSAVSGGVPRRAASVEAGLPEPGGTPAPVVAQAAGAEKKTSRPVPRVLIGGIGSVSVKTSVGATEAEAAREVAVPGPGSRAPSESMARHVEAAAAAPKDVSVKRADLDRRPATPGGPGMAEFALATGKRPAAGRTSVTLGLAKYGGDWDCSPTAMMYLSHQIGERTGMSLDVGHRTIELGSPELIKVPFVYMTGHKDFTFSEREVRNLRRYLEQGGYLWVDDSTHFNDNAFDRAFRREVARLLPEAEMERLDASFAAFRTGYDLTGGYKGYAIPPGDKYRLDYIEGVRVGDRVAVIYTRNDYGDGLNIDPNTHPLMPSLTDLSPAEMQEGAVRMGVNMVLYFLSAGGTVKTSIPLDEAPVVSAPKEPQGQARIIEPMESARDWVFQEWADPGTARVEGDRLAVDFSLGSNRKTAFSRTFDGAVRLGASDSLVVDAENRLQCGAQLAIGVVAGGEYHETPPFYLKPGTNTAFFRMSARTFKTEATEWQYRAGLGLPASVEALTVLIYSPAPGRIVLDNLRVVTEK